MCFHKEDCQWVIILICLHNSITLQDQLC
jgi:hypothetical protein